MNHKDPDSPTLSLLDRLLDDSPEQQDIRDPDLIAQERRRLTWDAWREGLARDIEKLLSTRPVKSDVTPGSRSDTALGAYGLQPGNAANLASRILQAIERFEPGLLNPKLHNAATEQGIAATIAGDVRWNGGTRRVILKVQSARDGFEVGIYE